MKKIKVQVLYGLILVLVLFMSLSLLVFLVDGFLSVRFLLCLIPVSPVRVCCVCVFVSPDSAFPVLF